MEYNWKILGIQKKKIGSLQGLRWGYKSFISDNKFIE